MNLEIISLAGIGMSYMSEMQEARELKLEEIKQAWEDSKNLPRKKKKQRRKELKIDWSIFSWNPFEYNIYRKF